MMKLSIILEKNQIERANKLQQIQDHLAQPARARIFLQLPQLLTLEDLHHYVDWTE